MLSVVIILSSAYLFIFSKSGLLERMKLDNDKMNISSRTEALKSENTRLRRLLDRYRAGTYPDGDIASSGYTNPNDTIILFRGFHDRPRGKIQKNSTVSEFPFDLTTLRILWIALSSIVVILMLVYDRRMKEQQAP